MESVGIAIAIATLVTHSNRDHGGAHYKIER